jgi:hypothetical protein
LKRWANTVAVVLMLRGDHIAALRHLSRPRSVRRRTRLGLFLIADSRFPSRRSTYQPHVPVIDPPSCSPLLRPGAARPNGGTPTWSPGHSPRPGFHFGVNAFARFCFALRRLSAKSGEPLAFSSGLPSCCGGDVGVAAWGCSSGLFNGPLLIAFALFIFKTSRIAAPDVCAPRAAYIAPARPRQHLVR